MPFYADLHIHSRFARATSKDADLEHMALWAGRKGITVLGTGDFTHPGWFTEIKEKLVPAEPGLFRLRPDLEREVHRQLPAACGGPTRFLLEVEISTIYKKGDKVRKVHHLIYAPDLEKAGQLIQKLGRIGNLNADGRPILGLDSRNLLEITLECGEGCYLIPAHIWTPWFSVLGSKSGFDRIAECYGDLTPHIFALETGLSSDPPMNWRLSQLDRYRLVSNSDAHSPGKIGREACAFDTELDYFAMRRALETGEGYGGTVEFFPEEGKYHLDGCRKCGVALEPEQTREREGLCPKCGKPVTVGVMHRVVELADRPNDSSNEPRAPYRNLIPLPEVLSEVHQSGEQSKPVQASYENLLARLGSELFVLEQAPVEEVRRHGSPLIAEAIARMRESRVICQAGYDGEYGVIRLFTDDELTKGDLAGLLFDLPPGTAASSAEQNVGGATAPEAERGRSPSAAVPIREIAPAVSSAAQRSADALLLKDEPRSKVLAALDPDQRAAAEVTDGPLMIIAGPGTGKTRTLTHRIAHLIVDKEARSDQCLAVTFTRRAAGEMAERLTQLMPDAQTIVPVMTFHSLGYTILQGHGQRLGLSATWRVANEAERRALLGEKLAVSEHKAQRLLKRISQARCSGETGDSKLTSTLACYDAAMREAGWLDFDDLIGLAVELLERNPDLAAFYQARYRWISVDEFQDIDARQYRLLRLLVPAGGNLCVIGDPDQAIYGFRGTDFRFFQRFWSDFPNARTVHLTRNYRSSRAIVEGALQVVAPSTLLEERVLEPLSEDTARITIHESPTDRAEAEFVVHTIEQLVGGSSFFALDSGRVETARDGEFAFADFAVLYRTDTQADLVCEALARSGIPFQKRSHTPLLEHLLVQAVLAAAGELPGDQPVVDRLEAAARMLAVRSSRGNKAQSSVPHSALRIPQSTDSPAIGSQQSDVALPTLLAALEPLARRCGNDLNHFQSELALTLDVDLWDPRADHVSLLTLHASKGLEFSVVFIVGCENGILPLRFGADDNANEDEERRLFFVGMTRARRRLLLSHAKKRLWRGTVREQTISPFIRDIEQTLLELRKANLPKPRPKEAMAQLDLFAP